MISADEWQPIETAPKRVARNILLFVPIDTQPMYIVGLWHGGGWVETYDGEDIAHPTHWMDLPPPPVTP